MITTIDDYSYRCEQKEEGEEPSPQKAITDASTAGPELSSPCTHGRKAEVKFVNAVTDSGSVKFLPAV